MLKRLQKVQPQYCVSEWVDDWTRNAKLTEMITAYPEPPKSQRDKRVMRYNIKWTLYYILYFREKKHQL